MAFSIAAEGVLTKIVQAVGIATFLGGGTLLIKAERDNAVQDTQIAQQQTLTLAVVGKMDKIADEMNETNKKLERIAGRMEGGR